MALTNTYDNNTPSGSDDPAEADNRMREIKAAVQERMNDKNGVADGGDHYWPLTGTEVSDVDTGEHRKVTLRVGSAPTNVANKGFLYLKDVGAKGELHFQDEDGNEIVMSSLGNNLANATYLTATDEAGTGSVDLIKAGRNVADDTDVAIVSDLTRTASNAAPVEDTDLPNKKYVDDQDIDSVGTGVSKSKDTNYTAATSGKLVVLGTDTWVYNVDHFIVVKSDDAATPTTIVGKVGGKCLRGDSAQNKVYFTFNVPIIKGKKYRVEDTGAVIDSITFYPNQ